MTAVMSPADLEAALRRIGAERYHDQHPFHHLLHGGELTKGQVQAWALNRFAYQAIIPRKDAALLAKLPTRELRIEWRQRMFDHDGIGDDEGGIERWLVLTSALGLKREDVISLRAILPGTRFAVEAYLHFVQDRPILEGIASSLTELFAPNIHRERIAGLMAHYDFVDDSMLGYFRRRLDQAPRDVTFALEYVKENARSPESQQAVLAAMEFKTSMLWAQLDALYLAYVTPGIIAPGAFVPEAAN
ncbi:MAG: pyrroloquinoline-quinone synthase PqqC [Rhodospirillaceae bacterium]|nr:pyrroloquinoline-quinone synthase PqqC [Rhodospirillaceae bacterium]MBT6830714.1 pyrroloquinoline-quinone synthase PqqC [Rhodospirillaceae bacterium]